MRAYVGTDVQSDRQAAQKLSPAYAQGKWHEAGSVICGYISALLSSAWTGARGFSFLESLSNSLCAYYFLAVNLMLSMRRYGPRVWKTHYFPESTLRCCMNLCLHTVIAAMNFPGSLRWDPRSRGEAAAEQFFAAIKSHCRGKPSMKDGILGCQVVHARQMKRCDSLPAMANGQHIQQVSADQMGELCRNALKASITLTSWLCVSLACHERWTHPTPNYPNIAQHFPTTYNSL